MDLESVGYSKEESTDECHEQVKTSKNVFSIGKQIMQNFIKWSFCDYEMSSPTSYLYSLSKRPTKLSVKAEKQSKKISCVNFK